MLKSYWKVVEALKKKRPRCSGNPNGTHTMVEYQSTGTKTCVDCQYTESLYIEVK